MRTILLSLVLAAGILALTPGAADAQGWRRHMTSGYNTYYYPSYGYSAGYQPYYSYGTPWTGYYTQPGYSTGYSDGWASGYVPGYRYGTNYGSYGAYGTTPSVRYYSAPGNFYWR